MNPIPGAVLTFDDGPIDDKGQDVALKTILDVLDANGIQGIFYVLGEEVQKQPRLVRLIAERGHILQSHAWSHVQLPKLPEAQLFQSLQRTQDLIFQTAGVRPNRLRPPYGAGFVGPKCPMLQKVATALELQLTGWDVDTNDWKAPRGLAHSEKCEPARKHWKAMHAKWGRPLDMLMHVNQATARDLKDFILGLKTEGWELRTYGDPPQQRPSVSVA